jgi:ATP-dependent DNA helicase PIF1
MPHTTSIEALDRTLKDLRNNTSVIGGVTDLFVGDFRQTLPVIPRGTRADEVNSCLKRSYVWSKIQKLSLTVYMRTRLVGENNSDTFSNLLLKLGSGEIAEHDGRKSFVE